MNQIYYVYEYIDPRTCEIFYIGKGKGNRYLVHLQEAKIIKERNLDYLDFCNPEKLKRIIDLLDLGLEPIIHFYVEGLSEEEAYNIEYLRVEECKSNHPLTNIVCGGQDGFFKRRNLIGEEAFLRNLRKKCQQYWKDHPERKEFQRKNTKQFWSSCASEYMESLAIRKRNKMKEVILKKTPEERALWNRRGVEGRKRYSEKRTPEQIQEARERSRRAASIASLPENKLKNSIRSLRKYHGKKLEDISALLGVPLQEICIVALERRLPNVRSLWKEDVYWPIFLEDRQYIDTTTYQDFRKAQSYKAISEMSRHMCKYLETKYPKLKELQFENN